MQNRKQLLKKVKQYIDTELNPSQKNCYDNLRDDYEEVKSIDEILEYLEISVIMNKPCPFLMIKIFKYTLEDYQTHAL